MEKTRRLAEMSTPENDPRFANEIARIQEQTRENNARSGRILTGWLILGTVVGIGTWFSQASEDREASVACAVSQ
jgi:hypothetical protein